MKVDADVASVKALLGAAKASYTQFRDSDGPDLLAALEEIKGAGIGLEEDAIKIYNALVQIYNGDFAEATKRLLKYSEFIMR